MDSVTKCKGYQSKEWQSKRVKEVLGVLKSLIMTKIVM